MDSLEESHASQPAMPKPAMASPSAEAIRDRFISEGGCRDCSAEGSQGCSRNSKGEAKAEGPGLAQAVDPAADPAAPGVHGLPE